MSGIAVMVAIPDQDLRRSVEFVLRAHGYEPVAADAVEDALFAIFDEVALGDVALQASPTHIIIVLSSRPRPPGTPQSWWWLEKPHLGEALENAVEEASNRTLRDSTRS